jgi:hypothetical protein
MCSVNCAFVGESNFNIIKMHGTTIKILYYLYSVKISESFTYFLTGCNAVFPVLSAGRQNKFRTSFSRFYSSHLIHLIFFLCQVAASGFVIIKISLLFPLLLVSL